MYGRNKKKKDKKKAKSKIAARKIRALESYLYNLTFSYKISNSKTPRSGPATSSVGLKVESFARW